MASELNLVIKAQNEASEAIKAVKGDISDLGNAAGDAEGKTGGLASALGTGLVTAASAAAVASAAVGAAMVAVAVDGTKMAAELEAQMSGIAAVLGKTKEEVAPLKDLILELGVDPNLKVSAIEAADAIEMLARNGLSMSEIMEGAAMNTVLLANATGADFGTAADIATDSMAQFKIEAEDMGSAVDGIVSVVNNSKLGIDDYGLALANAGGVAGAIGVSFDDFNTALAATAPLFSSGADAGTGLRNFLLRLSPTTKTAGDAMEELGIITLNAEKAMVVLNENGIQPAGDSIGEMKVALFEAAVAMGAVDAEAADAQKQFDTWIESTGLLQNEFFEIDGSMKSMAEISGVLQDALSGLSDEQQATALKVIFGNDAMRTAVGLADEGTEGFAALQAQMSETDALESAAERMDNLAGAMEILKGIVDTIKIRIGDAFLPVVREMTDALSAFLDAHADAIVAFFESFAEWITTAVESAKSIVEGFGSMTEGGNEMAGFMETVPALIEAVHDVFTELVTRLEPLGPAFVALIEAMQPVVDFMQDVLLGAVDALLAGFEAAWPAAGDIIDAFVENAVAVIELITTIITAFVEGIQALIAGDWDAVWEQAGNVVQAFQDAFEAKLNLLQTIAETAITAATAVIVDVLNQMGLDGEAIVDGFKTMWETTWDAIKEKAGDVWEVISGIFSDFASNWGDTWETMQSIVDGVWAVVEPIWSSIQTWLDETLPGAIDSLSSGWLEAWGSIQTALADMWEAVEPIWQAILDWIQDKLPSGMGEMEESWTGFIDTVQPLWDLFMTFIEPHLERLSEGFQKVAEDLGPLGEKFAALAEAAMPVLEALATLVGAVVIVAFELFLSAIEAILPQIVTIVGAGVEQVTAALNLIDTVITEVVAAVKAIIDGDWKRVWKSAENIFEAFAEFFTGTLENLQTVVEAIIQAIKDFVVNVMTDMGLDGARILNEFETKWKAVWNAIKTAITNIWTNGIKPILTALNTFLTVDVANAAIALKDSYDTTWTAIGNIVTAAIKVVTDAIDKIQEALDRAKDALNRFKDWIGNLNIPNPLSGIQMPSLPSLSDLNPWGDAAGTSWFPGGWTRINERGPEPIILPGSNMAWLPQGTQIISHEDSQHMGLGGGDTYITVNVENHTPMDWEVAAWRVAGIIQRRQRR